MNTDRRPTRHKAYLVLLLASLWLPGLAVAASERPTALAQTRGHLFPRASVTAPVNGLPDWVNGFIPGVTGTVYAVAAAGDQVYIGGDFSQVGGIEAHNIALWDGAQHAWFRLDGGPNGTIYSLAIHGSDLYAGGSYNGVGTTPAAGLARWSTISKTWSVPDGYLIVQNGQSSFVGTASSLLFAPNGDLYVAGSFDHVGNVVANCVARWDGTAWHALDSGVCKTGDNPPTFALALARVGGDLFIGGSFDEAGSVGVANIARWDGTAWHSLGGGVGMAGNNVNALAAVGSYLYVGGSFGRAVDSLGVHTVHGIVRWNGSTWDNLQGGVTGGWSNVHAIAEGPNGIYAAGNFGAAGVVTATNMARWDGANWHALREAADSLTDGLGNGTVYALAASGNDLYAGSDASRAGRHYAFSIADWNSADQLWYSLANGPNDSVFAVAASGRDVYLGGYFTSAGGIHSLGIARYNLATRQWSKLGQSGIAGCVGVNCFTVVHALAVSGDNVYIGGNFTSVGGVTAHNVARWNRLSNTWTGFDKELLGFSDGVVDVRALAVDGARLWVGGDFDFMNNHDGQGIWGIHHITYWDGSQWNIVRPNQFTIGADGIVYAIVPDGAGGVYIGGDFAQPYPGLFYFAGSSGMPVGNGLNGGVYALAVTGNPLYPLYIGGSFSNAGGSGADNIAVLGPLGWSPLGNSLNGPVTALALDARGGLYAGGLFSASGVLGLDHVAYWDPSPQWTSLGVGVDATVQDLAVSGNELIAGGFFERAGNRPSSFFGVWGPHYESFLPIALR